ncbi:MAG: hypothetical protein JJU29_18320 [Verrucomicrobia bacterium]|nr:hypothetical protein [Verrucomicrobiota bacterium]MCH8512891.1 hypothetical protein [Kiritimatiellia bacterium]
MKSVTVTNYQEDRYYPKVVRSAKDLLEKQQGFNAVEVMIAMGNLTPEKVRAWQKGQVPYLEKIFAGNLSKANRILRILRFHAHDLNLKTSVHPFRQQGSKHITLRCSKTGEPAIEEAYARHFYPANQSFPSQHGQIRNL